MPQGLASWLISEAFPNSIAASLIHESISRHSNINVFEKGTEIEYNALATNNMYTFVKGLIDMNKPARHGVAPFFFDRKPIHTPLREILRKKLGVVAANLPKS